MSRPASLCLATEGGAAFEERKRFFNGQSMVEFVLTKT